MASVPSTIAEATVGIPMRPRRSSAAAAPSVRRFVPTSRTALTGASADTAKSAVAATPSVADVPAISHGEVARAATRSSTSR